MDEPLDLETVYEQAQEALDAKDFQRARDLFKQILLIDENYRDASRLLAKVVKQQQFRWYRSRWLLGAVGAVVVIVLYVIIASVIIKPTPSSSLPPSRTPQAVSTRVSETPSLIPTSVPLTWSRFWVGQELGRDNITAIALDPTDPDILYVGTAHAGIYKSIDGGTSWKPIISGLGNASVDSLQIAPGDTSVLYAGLNNAGVYKSSDGGEHWIAMNEGANPMHISVLIVDPEDTQHLYFAGDSIYEWKDDGPWKQAKDPKACPVNLHDMIIHPTDSNTLYAADDGGQSGICAGGIYQSTDGGRNWVTLVEAEGINDLAIDSILGQYIYATSNNEWIHTSSDSGITWRQNKFPCSALAVDPNNGAVAYCQVESGELMVTRDAGISWQPLTDPAVSRIGVIVPAPGEGGVIYVGGRGLVGSTDGGVSWENLNAGLGAARLNLVFDRMNSAVIYGLDSAVEGNLVYQSKDGGRKWEFMMGETSSLTIDADGKTFYRLWQNQAYRSTDGGETWVQFEAPSSWWLGVISAHPTIPGLLFLYSWETPFIYRSFNSGESWQSDQGFSDLKELKGGWFFFSPSQEKKIYLAGFEKVFRSADAGETWTACAQLEGMLAGTYSQLAIDPHNDDHIFLATRGNGILSSRDGCQSWETSNDGLGNLFVNTLAIDPQSPQTVYAGTDGGAYVSFDGGMHWGQVNEGLLGATVVYSIVIDSENNVYAATPYGVFHLKAP
jgi:photosystem II stability/assembly factor-like uncharacterized protein